MKLRVMSYNVQSGFANGREIHNYLPQAEHIASYSPDVVALQEVSIRHPFGKPIDYPTLVARHLGMNYAFAKALDYADYFPGCDGCYGVAVLSKYPVELITSLMLPVPEGIEPRTAVITRIHAPEPFYMISTHLSYQGEFEGDAEGRIEQLATIFRYLDANGLYPAILAGDLNSQPDDASIYALREKFDVFNDGRSDQPTANSQKFGWVQIDYISAAPKGAVRCEKFFTGNDCTASDHYAVLADLEI
ncbi:MAG: hypothetical protein E7043_00555 [Lentisphaerae bacterium]|nr:hypothetical protein [Lentisphaerota bacterium]